MAQAASNAVTPQSAQDEGFTAYHEGTDCPYTDATGKYYWNVGYKAAQRDDDGCDPLHGWDFD